MTHPFHRLADTTQRMFLALMAADPRSPLAETQRAAVWVCLKDHAWRVGSGGPVPVEVLEGWYDTLQRQWKVPLGHGNIAQK
jgi:hypothetical protein